MSSLKILIFFNLKFLRTTFPRLPVDPVKPILIIFSFQKIYFFIIFLKIFLKLFSLDIIFLVDLVDFVFNYSAHT